MQKIRNYIDGKFIEPGEGSFLENMDPSVGKAYSLIPDSTEKDVNKAVEAASKAFTDWSKTPASVKAEYMQQAADLIQNKLDIFAAAESKDNGKPLSLASTVDIPRAVSNLKFFASAIQQFASESHYMEGVGVNYTLRKPLGVVACISPWNLPLYLFTWKIAPALAAGNCIVAKPSEVTPMSAYMLSQVFDEVGLPAGVFNIVHGLGHKAGGPLTEHPSVKAVSFTGGTATGKQIAANCAPKFKKLSLEMGGKNPNVIFDDCNFDQMLKTTVRSSFANQGQICLCGSRILIQDGIYDRFKEAFVEATSKLKVSFPEDPEANLGAIVSQTHYEKVLSYIQLAQEEGGTVLTGGEAVKLDAPHENGYYIRPTVIEGLPQNCRTNMEEIFGPVVTLQRFKTEEEALEIANATEYGLAATVWTQDLNRAHRVADKIESGIVWINSWLVRDLRTPFGGMKSSGVGREGGWEALRFFTEPKNVFVRY